MRIWRVDENRLRPVPPEKLPLEQTLEDWLADDISMVSDDLLVISRQLTSPLGGILDLLAIDPNGDLTILELKRDKTPRDIVGQILHYAAWIRTLTWDEIRDIACEYFGGVSLSERFQQRFGQPLPETLNGNHRMCIVATDLDPRSETIVNYLSGVHSVDINVVFFRHYRDADGAGFVARSWLLDPYQVAERAATSGARRRPPLSLLELRAQAVEQGVAEVYNALYDFLSRNGDAIRRTPNNVAFVFATSGGQTAAFSAYPNRSSREQGLYTDVRPAYLAEAFDVSEDAVRVALPLAGSSNDAHGEVYWFRSIEEVGRLTEALGERQAEPPEEEA
jgi:hypothetical protein